MGIRIVETGEDTILREWEGAILRERGRHYYPLRKGVEDAVHRSGRVIKWSIQRTYSERGVCIDWGSLVGWLGVL